MARRSLARHALDQDAVTLYLKHGQAGLADRDVTGSRPILGCDCVLVPACPDAGASLGAHCSFARQRYGNLCTRRRSALCLARTSTSMAAATRTTMCLRCRQAALSCHRFCQSCCGARADVGSVRGCARTGCPWASATSVQMFCRCSHYLCLHFALDQLATFNLQGRTSELHARLE